MSAGAPEQFGPYLVYEELGMGGMAAVHRAETRGIEGFTKPVALKRMLPGVAVNHDLVESFIREARIASHLRHVNVAQTYELGRVGGIYFIAMELVTGRNLRQILRHCGGLAGQLPVPIALNILNQICDALDYAHNLCDESGKKLGIIHRDVSPSNIIVSEEGVVKLIDFGIAKASAAGMQTMSGMLKGKFGYMAPEYIAGSIDARADLFAVGVIAHELLTNRPLFTVTDDMATLERVRKMPIAPPSRRNPRVPKEIDDVVMTALERDPDRRWQHATALRSALTTLTKRFALDVTSSEVSRWLDWVFDATKRDEVARSFQSALGSVPPQSADEHADDRDATSVDGRSPETAVIAPAAPSAPAAGAAIAGGRTSGLSDAGVPLPPSRPPARTLLGGASAPNLSLAALQGKVAAPSPSPLGSQPMPVVAPASGAHAVVPAALPPLASPVRSPHRDGGGAGRLALVAILLLVIAAAGAVVVYLSLS